MLYSFMNNFPSLLQSVTIYEVTPANTVHMLWLIPQYFVITVSEIMFSITGLEFSFMQVCNEILLCVKVYPFVYCSEKLVN